MTPLPMSVRTFLATAAEPALALLPRKLDTPEARVLLSAISLQESGLATRRQYGNGPARGLQQFELGTAVSRGGVFGVFLHPASNELLRQVCRARDCGFEPRAIWAQIELDDVLAAAVSRLLLLTDPAPLPAVSDVQGGWDYYNRVWKPGKPRLQDWPANHRAAVQGVAA